MAEQEEKIQAESAEPESAAEEREAASEATQPSEAAGEQESYVLESEYRKAVAESEDNKRKWYLVTAEYENYRKRTASAKQTAYLDGKAEILLKILPVADNLERAISVCRDPKTKEGIEMVLRSFKKVLEGEEIEEIDPLGEPFDPAIAEAIMASPAEEGEEAGIVKQVCLKGYRRKDKVLRFAQVIVTQ